MQDMRKKGMKRLNICSAPDHSGESQSLLDLLAEVQNYREVLHIAQKSQANYKLWDPSNRENEDRQEKTSSL